MTIKQQLYKHCEEYSRTHIEIIRKTLDSAQQSANSESKSTAGDKHETGRAMAQLETETFGCRLVEALEQHKMLESIDPAHPCKVVQAGALVRTSMGAFFIAISADEIEIGGEEYCPISLASPIGQAIKGLKAGECGEFRGKKLQVVAVE